MLNKQRINNKALEAFKLCQGIAPNAKSMIIKCDLLANGAADVSIEINGEIVTHTENNDFNFTPADLDLPFLFSLDEIQKAYMLAANSIVAGLKDAGIEERLIKHVANSYRTARPALMCMLLDIETARRQGGQNDNN